MFGDSGDLNVLIFSASFYFIRLSGSVGWVLGLPNRELGVQSPHMVAQKQWIK